MHGLLDVLDEDERSVDLAASTMVASIILNLNETITRQ
jgi:hypothetical protein